MKLRTFDDRGKVMFFAALILGVGLPICFIALAGFVYAWGGLVGWDGAYHWTFGWWQTTKVYRDGEVSHRPASSVGAYFLTLLTTVLIWLAAELCVVGYQKAVRAARGGASW